VARDVGRSGELARVLTLDELASYPADMRTCAFVGNAQTKVVAGRLVTPRGYVLGGE
jgi:precorrin-3B C17-methyltransferase